METLSNKAIVVPAEAAAGSPDDEWVPLTYASIHDVVAPANQVSSLAGLLIRQYGTQLGEEAELMVALLQDSVTRLQNLLAGFRTYARIVGTRAPLQLCDGNALLAHSLASAQAAIAESSASVTHDRFPALYCDPAQIGYVLTGLIENSLKFRGPERCEVHLSAVSHDDAWILSVRDNGIGIDPKHHKSIFEMFKRVHNEQYPGAGVGLAIAQRIVQRHGGRIWVESELGRGAAVFFSLPRERVPGEQGNARAYA